MLSIGIDSGSTATKGILFSDEDGGVILRRFLIPTPFRPQSAILEARKPSAVNVTPNRI